MSVPKLKKNDDRRKDERIRLQEALKVNQPLATAYYMKERLRSLFQLPQQEQAQQELKDWINEAHASGIKSPKDAAKQL